MAWAEDYRQNWIAETLRVFGFINRAHIQRKFSVSVAQASLDLRRFQAEQPGLKAGALIVAEIERLDRLSAKQA